MKLEEIKNLLLNSERADWSLIHCESYGNGPSYKNKLRFDYSIEEPNKIYSHRVVAVYRPDISITMAYDLICEEDLDLDWLERFDDSSPSLHFVDVFYNNALVLREKFIKIDNCKLPYPRRIGKDKRLVVNLQQYALIEFLQKLSFQTDDSIKFSYYFDKSGIEIDEGEWE